MWKINSWLGVGGGEGGAYEPVDQFDVELIEDNINIELVNEDIHVSLEEDYIIDIELLNEEINVEVEINC
jgi:hypothetical protein